MVVYGGAALFASTSATAGTVILAGATQLSVEDGIVTGRRSYTLGGVIVGYRDTATRGEITASATDRQGSVSIQTNPDTLAAATGWIKRTYNPYGSLKDTTGDLAWSGIDGWLGKPTPPGSDLVQLGARQYDPDLQQFTSPDPLLDAARSTSFNPYTYANHNPISFTDPSGLMGWMGTPYPGGTGAGVGVGAPISGTAYAGTVLGPAVTLPETASAVAGFVLDSWFGTADAVLEVLEPAIPAALCVLQGVLDACRAVVGQSYDAAVAVFTNNPIDTASKIVESKVAPYQAAAARGAYGEILGRFIVDAAMLAVGIGWVTRAVQGTTALRGTAAGVGATEVAGIRGWLRNLWSGLRIQMRDDRGSVGLPGRRGYTPSGAAADFDVDELAQFAYQHSGEGFAEGATRPSLSEISGTLERGGVTQLEGQSAVRVDWRGVRVIINEDEPWSSTAYYLGH